MLSCVHSKSSWALIYSTKVAVGNSSDKLQVDRRKARARSSIWNVLIARRAGCHRQARVFTLLMSEDIHAERIEFSKESPSQKWV